MRGTTTQEWINSEGALASYDANDWRALTFLNLDYSKGTMMAASSCNYFLKEKPHYISRHLLRFGYNKKAARIIEVCEKADKPFVLETNLDSVK